jgi:hypothetical protein
MENWHPPYSRGRFCAATAGTGASRPDIGLFGAGSSVAPGVSQLTVFCIQSEPSWRQAPDEANFAPYLINVELSGDVVAG